MVLPAVTFVLIDREPPSVLATLEPDRDWKALITGERALILQTFLRLRDAGLGVQLQPHLPQSGIAVFSAKQHRELRATLPNRSTALLVGVRGDMAAVRFADYEIVQNPRQADDTRRVFITHWPQPGLLRRDPRRGTRVETLGYKGFSANLHPRLTSREWLAFLDAEGLHWAVDATEYTGPDTSADRLAWNDYRQLDVVVALRPPDRRLHPRKPATKLYNAWRAGVPAILGPERAYRALRESELDYLEATSLDEVRAAVRRLRRDPALYAAMVEHGFRRATAFSPARITEAWSGFLDNLTRTSQGRPSRSIVPRWWRSR